MRMLGLLSIIMAALFALVGMTYLEGLQSSLLGSISGALADLVNSLSLIVVLLVGTLFAGGIVAAIGWWTR